MNKRKLYTIFFFGLISISFQSSLFSQAVRATVDRNRIFIGEQVKLKLSVEKGKPGMSWFNLPDSVNHLEIVKKGKIDTVLNGGYTNYNQTITVTSFDSGRWEFPPLSLPGISQPTLPINIDVLPVDVSKMQDYNDIKDIEEVKQGNNSLITGIIVIVTLISMAIVYFLLVKNRKVVRPVPNLRGKLSPLEWALAELNKLHRQTPNSPVEVKKYYSDLTNISRTFFSKQLRQPSFQQTTDEWMFDLQSLSVDSDTKTSFFQFLRLSDTVKFAKFLPPSRENEMSVSAIKQMLQRVSMLDSAVHLNYQPKQH